jgi:pSer/pThr/pTyr-binding forkhead associated (FHA) protein
MHYQLILQNHVEGFKGKKWTFSAPASVGRDPTCDLCFDHDSISRQHCQFSLNGEGGLVIKDLESMNGIYVDDRRVQHATLMPHQLLQVGALIMQIEFLEEEPRKPSSRGVGSTYATQPMQTLRSQGIGAAASAAPPSPQPAAKPWWRRLFE